MSNYTDKELEGYAIINCKTGKFYNLCRDDESKLCNTLIDNVNPNHLYKIKGELKFISERMSENCIRKKKRGYYYMSEQLGTIFREQDIPPEDCEVIYQKGGIWHSLEEHKEIVDAIKADWEKNKIIW